MPRVILVNRFFPPDRSATAQHFADLAADLAGCAVDVHVVTSRQCLEGGAPALPRRELRAGARVHRVASSRLGGAAPRRRLVDYATFAAAAAARVARLCRPGDRVVAGTDPPLLACALAPVVARRGAALVAWVHDLFPEVAEALGVLDARSRAASGLRTLRDRALRRCTAVVAVGEAMARRLRQRGLPPGAVRVVHNWSAVRVPVAADAPRAAIPGLDRALVIGYHGSLGRAHEHETVLGAARILAARRDVGFVFAGGGTQREALAARVRSSGLRNVSFLPPVARGALAERLAGAGAHLVVLRPEVEGLVMPSKLYAALAAGRPVIFVGDPRGEAAELVRSRGCGLVVPAGGSRALAAAVDALARDPDRRAALGRAARTAFEREFTMERGLRAWRALLGVPGSSARGERP